MRIDVPSWEAAVTAPHEEGVDRVRQTLPVAVVIDRGGGGEHSLGNHLAAVNPARELRQGTAGEEILPITRRQAEDPGH